MIDMGVFIFGYFVAVCRLVIYEEVIPVRYRFREYTHTSERCKLLDDTFDDSDTYRVGLRQ